MKIMTLLLVAAAAILPLLKIECKNSMSSVEQMKHLLLKNRTRTDLINYLITKHGYQTYLEIGLADGKNLESVIAPHKVGIDPSPASPATHRMTSDAFFAVNKETFDIVFVDGLHLYEQALKDVENALACLNPGGVIVMHDLTLPPS